MCGFDNAAWVLAFRQIKLNIPLTDLGPGHESWGMTMKGWFPSFTSRRTQHISYAEAGIFWVLSFGYLWSGKDKGLLSVIASGKEAMGGYFRNDPLGTWKGTGFDILNQTSKKKKVSRN
jgi:hypothetical protein